MIFVWDLDFLTSIMIKIIQNLKSWSKEKLPIDYSVILRRIFQKFIIVWVTFGFNINIQSNKLYE